MVKKKTPTGPSPTTGSRSDKKKEGGKEGTPRRRITSLDKRRNALPPKVATPAWIKYYEEQAKDATSPYGKGFQKPIDHYERLMESYVSSEDQFFDTLKENPEACSIIFADNSGNMRILHHLTAENHGKPIIVGLAGLGSMSEVKAVHEELFVNKVVLDDEDEKKVVLDLENFISNTIDDIDTSDKIDPGEEASEFTSLSQVFLSQPKGYLIHPKWLPRIYTTLGRPPEIIGKAIVDSVRRELDEGGDLEEALDDFYPFLVYLWACHLGLSVRHQFTYSIESTRFEEIQADIASKVFIPGSSTRVDRETEGGIFHQNREQAPSPSSSPSTSSPSPSPQRRDRRGRSSSPRREEHRARGPRRGERRPSHSRSRDRYPSRSRSSRGSRSHSRHRRDRGRSDSPPRDRISS